MTKSRFNLKLTVQNFRRYLPLLQNLVAREMKNKYRQSVLGYAWCILNPLLVMLIMTFVFSSMFSSSIQNFPVYLFCGRMIFSFITDATKSAQKSIVSNAMLLRKTRVPTYIFTLANFCTACVNFLFQFAAFALVLLLTRTPVTVHALMLPVLLLEVFLFAGGLGLFLACLHVFLRDTDYLYSVLITAWTYLTPIFYPFSALPDWLQRQIALMNPAYHYVEQCRQMFLYHQWLSMEHVLPGLAAGLIACVLGCVCYDRARHQMILYL